MSTIAVRRLLERFSVLKPALPADRLPWRPSPFVRTPRSLPVHYELSPAFAGLRRPEPSGEPSSPALKDGGEDGGDWRPTSGLRAFLRRLRRAQ
jgi:hypothetical protein